MVLGSLLDMSAVFFSESQDVAGVSHELDVYVFLINSCLAIINQIPAFGRLNKPLEMRFTLILFDISKSFFVWTNLAINLGHVRYIWSMEGVKAAGKMPVELCQVRSFHG